MTDTHQEPLVSNPWYSGLQNLRQRLVLQAGEISSALDDAAARMGGGATWTGPAANRFAAEVAGRKRRLGVLTQQLVDAVDAQLRTTPERVPLSEAKLMRIELQAR
jgi:hypothetical protein